MKNNDEFSSYEEKIRKTVSEEEAILLIENTYDSRCDPHWGADGCFDTWNQLLACESMVESTAVRNYLDQETKESIGRSENENVNGMKNDGCQQIVKFVLTASKLQAIEKLKICNYLTTPKEIAGYLEEFFKEYKSYEYHWLYVAQHWNPRAINRTFSMLIKLHESGRATIRNWARFFTFLIKKREMRRSL
jgi:hypothetical protein